jgi:hypothetical protein
LSCFYHAKILFLPYAYPQLKHKEGMTLEQNTQNSFWAAVILVILLALASGVSANHMSSATNVADKTQPKASANMGVNSQT